MSAVTVVGSCNLDLIVEVPALPRPGETVLGDDVVTRPGGKGANQAVAARRPGATTSLVAAVGDDQFGRTLRAGLEREQLDLAQVVVLDVPTGVALITVDRGATNTIVVAAGANRRLGAEHLARLGNTLAPGSVLLLQLEIPLAACIAATRIAREHGAQVVVNAAPLPDPDDRELAELLSMTDVLIVNETETAALLSVSPTAAPAEWARRATLARRLGHRADVVTLRAAGPVAADQRPQVAVEGVRVDGIEPTCAGQPR